jgi:hypothetical protein
MSLRKYFTGEPNVAANWNQPWDDLLTQSGYLIDGSDFAGFTRANPAQVFTTGSSLMISSATPLTGYAAPYTTPNGDVLQAGFSTGAFFGPTGNASNAGNGLAGVTAALAFAPGTYTVPVAGVFLPRPVLALPPGVTVAQAVSYYVEDQTVGQQNYAILHGGNNQSLHNGPMIFGASNPARTCIRLPHGAAPIAPALTDGDLWTTAAGMFVRINGVVKSVNLT